jgi:hypothetical protein
MDGLFSAKLKDFDNQQKKRSESQMSRLQSELSSSDEYKFQRKSCEDQYKFNRKLTVALKEADALDFLSARICALKIFLSSSESSAKGFAVYSCTTLQPSSDESAILFNFW